MWSLLSGNSLQITPDLYAIFKERAVRLSTNSGSQDQDRKYDASSPESEDEIIDLEAGKMQGKEDSMNIICYDVPRTFAEIEVPNAVIYDLLPC